MQSARPRATFRSRRSTCAGRRVRSSSVTVRAQLSHLGVGAIERAFLSVFGHMKGHVCQRGRRSRQTQVMVYRMGISMEPVCLHGRIGMFLSEDGYILSRVRRGPTSLCPHGPGEPWGALGRPRGGPPWPSGGWTDPRARGRNPRGGKGVKLNLQGAASGGPCSRRATPARWGRRGAVLSDVKIAQAQTLVHAAYVPTEPTAAHWPRCGSKSRIIRTTDSSMTDPLSGRAAHDLPRTPPSVTLESNAVAISCVSPSSLKTRAGPSNSSSK